MADERVTHGMFLSVSGACECCDDVEAPSAAVLRRLNDDLLPPRGITRGLRLVIRENVADDEATRVDDGIVDHLRRVASTGFGRIDDDGEIVLPGVVIRACGNAH